MKMTRQPMLRIAVYVTIILGLMLCYCGWTWWRVTDGGEFDTDFIGVSFDGHPHTHWSDFAATMCIDWTGKKWGYVFHGPCMSNEDISAYFEEARKKEELEKNQRPSIGEPFVDLVFTNFPSPEKMALLEDAIEGEKLRVSAESNLLNDLVNEL